MTISLNPDLADSLRELARRHHGGKVSRAVAHMVAAFVAAENLGVDLYDEGVTKSARSSSEKTTKEDLT